MKDHIQVLKYLIDNPTLSIINRNSRVSSIAFKELFDQGYVDGIDISGDSSDGDFEFMSPKITLTGRQFLAKLSTHKI
ncbi:hypothetical protein ACPV3P_19415 [Photobacterium damselae]|uniref:hypothetical protein n=1 Tax=Photobacterium damselae TaxID=38293 RepID=UPI004068A504